METSAARKERAYSQHALECVPLWSWRYLDIDTACKHKDECIHWNLLCCRTSQNWLWM